MDGASATTPSPALVATWAAVIADLDLERAQQLLNSHVDLLWQPLDDQLEPRNRETFVSQLKQFHLLGSDLGGMSAIPFLLLDLDEQAVTLKEKDHGLQMKRWELLDYLVQHAEPADLDSRSWGDCHNKTLHLAAFLGHTRTMDLLVQRGASISVCNDLGHPPVPPRAETEDSGDRQRQDEDDDNNDNDNDSAPRPSALPRPKKSAERFKKLSEKSGSNDELLRHQTKRQQDIARLAQRSAVKNNPLFKKFEQSGGSGNDEASSRTIATPAATPSRLKVPQKIDLVRKNSKGINSLKNKSFVTSSVFRQREPPSRSPSPSMRSISPSTSAPSLDDEQPVGTTTTSTKQAEPIPSTQHEPVRPQTPPPATCDDIQQQQPAPTTATQQHSVDTDTDHLSQSEDMTEDIQPDNTDKAEPVSSSDDVHGSEQSQTSSAIDIVHVEPNAATVNDDNDPDQYQDEPDTPTQASVSRLPSSTMSSASASITANRAPTVGEADEPPLENSAIPLEGPLSTVEVPAATSVAASANDRDSEQPPQHDTTQEAGSSETHDLDKNRARFSTDSMQLSEAALRHHDTVSEGNNHRMSMRSEAGSEQFFDSYEEWTETPEKRMSLAPAARTNDSSSKRQSSPLRQSMLMMMPPPAVLNEDDGENPDDSESGLGAHHEPKPAAASEYDETSIASRTPPASFSPQQRRSMGAESVDTLPPFKEDGTHADEVPPPLPVLDHPARASHHSEYGSIAVQSTSYYVALDKLQDKDQPQQSDDGQDTDEQQQQQQHQQQQQRIEQESIQYTREQDERATCPPQQQQQQQPQYLQSEDDYGSVAYRSTSNYMTHRLPQQHDDMSEQYAEFSSHYRPPSVKLELPEVKSHPGQSTSAFGKLYIRISSAQNILLPLPKLTSYVRCVVSDGEFEFMSRYELLAQKVTFDYECIIDARPDMIITTALHVRPDPHVRPKTGLSKWLTPARKQRETIGGYVHPDDGAIGQTRFALGHMIQACNQKTYSASFDCFNSWYVRSSRERQRQQSMEEDILKVVGSMSIEMLYLPVTDPSLSIPKNLRECDLALRIRQWHDTCWHSGYLSIRLAGSQLWDRHYCRLIGSQMLGYASKTASSWKARVQYDIADALRLVASSDQVIVTLVDLPDTHVFQSDTIVEETGRGYFRIAFPETYIDCVCDEPYESEAWVKVLKSMIGRVPLKVPFML